MCSTSCLNCYCHLRDLHSFPTRRSSDLPKNIRNLPAVVQEGDVVRPAADNWLTRAIRTLFGWKPGRSEEHTSELQSRQYLLCRLLLEKKNIISLKVAMKRSPTLKNSWKI